MAIFKAELKTNYKPNKQKHYNYDDRISNSLLCRLRVGRSYLKSHGFSVNLSPTDKCLCGAIDDDNFFLLFCFLFQPERSEMLSKIKCFVPNFSCLSFTKQCEILLYGASSHKTNYINRYSKSWRASKSLYWFKSYGNFAERVDFAYWWSCIGKGLSCSIRSRRVHVYSSFEY